MSVIAVASGKGGTGKTCVASSLIKAAGRVTAVDADVEEPDLALLLDLKLKPAAKVNIPIPVFDPDRCTKCGKCASACKFNAIVQFGKLLPALTEGLCHGCGVCSMVCEENAISETNNLVGIVSRAKKGGLTLLEGRLEVGAPNPVPVIRKTIDMAIETGEDVIIDSPPGTACSMVEAVEDVDYVVLVTEPTPFGAADLKLAMQVVKQMNIPSGVVINRSDLGDVDIEEICGSYNIPVLSRIPFSREVAQGYASGRTPYDTDLQWRKIINNLWNRLVREVS